MLLRSPEGRSTFQVRLKVFLDAIPKKRGPKTDVLEALLKRVDGLERRLKEEKKSHSPTEPALDAAESSTNSGESKPIPLQQEGTNPAVEEDVLFSRPPIRWVIAVPPRKKVHS